MCYEAVAPRKSSAACSIDSVPILSAPSSRKNFGEWLLGAALASCPAGVAPTKK